MALECKNVSFSFKDNNGVEKQILKDLNFSLEENQIKLVYGHIGAGKSTLIYLLAGLLDDFEGEIVWDDFHFKHTSSTLDKIRSKYMSINFSNFFYIKDMDVENNIMFPAIFSKKKKSFINDRLEMMYDTFSNIQLSDTEVFDLKSFRKKKIGTMSNGQREIVMLARMLMNDSKYILADEMLRSFNTNVKKQMLEILFEKFHFGTSNSALVITHDDKMIEYMNYYSKGRAEITAYDFIDKTLRERK